MSDAIYKIPPAVNEPVYSYAPGSPERVALEAELVRQGSEVVEIPCVIGGEHVFTGNTVDVLNPCDHQQVLAKVHMAGPDEVKAAIKASLDAKKTWAAMPWEHRVAIFLKAADLLAGPHRARINAATMLGQAKTAHQSEIDAVAELCDFWRFNASYMQDIYAEQPPVSPAGIWNRLDHRPLDGFVFAVTPFNFSSIVLNLASAPAMVGNTVVLKPSPTSMASVWKLYQILEEAGLPAGVINLVNGHGADVGDIVLADPDLGGIHFTGSTATFQHMWKTVGMNITNYRQYPRLVGETGGKDFILAHASADAKAVAVAILRGAFEFNGQKCSAASRMYVPSNIWGDVKEHVLRELAKFKQGDVRDFSNMVSAVIDERAYKKISNYLAIAHETAEVLAGGGGSMDKGYYIEPTVVQVSDPKHKLMREEIFGPVATVYVYDPEDFDQVLAHVDDHEYALTGAFFAQDRHAIVKASEALRFAAGNFYINDKPTGAVVGQQPFGGGRASGTNDKAGSPLNLLRWISPRTIKENFVPPHDWRYPFLG